MNAKELHEIAMSYTDKGDVAYYEGEFELARTLFLEALVMERKAAEICRTQPSRGILFRSAAWLAISAGNPVESKRLAEEGLSDPDVPERVRSELQEVLEKACSQISGQDRGWLDLTKTGVRLQRHRTRDCETDGEC